MDRHSAQPDALGRYYIIGEDGWYQCRSCIYSTPHAELARRHAQIEHLAELEPIVVLLPRKGRPSEDITYMEE